MNTINYATQFQADIMQKYSRELLTADLTTQNVTFLNANTIKIPFLSVGGYKNHSRNGGFNSQDVEKKDMIKTLAFDRDVELFVDSMDVDESNQTVSAANVTNVFVTEHAIPETDAYRLSKLYADFVASGDDNPAGVIDKTVITKENVLSVFDGYMTAMDEDEVPEDGRILYVTPAISDMIKNAVGVSRNLNVGNAADSAINRAINALDNVKIVKIPSGRMKTAYNFEDGFVPAVGAKQMNMILVHPRSVIACDKHSYIRLWPEGTHTKGDGWLYQNRKYGDLFVVNTRKNGIKINTEA